MWCDVIQWSTKANMHVITLVVICRCGGLILGQQAANVTEVVGLMDTVDAKLGKEKLQISRPCI